MSNKELFMENKIKVMETTKQVSNLDSDYNKGLHDGIEFCLALLQNREAKYTDIGDYKIKY